MAKNSPQARTGLGGGPCRALPPAIALLLVCLMDLLSAGCHRLVEERASSACLRLDAGGLPVFGDDGDRSSLQVAIATSIRYWQGQDADREVSVCGGTYGPRDFLASLRKFKELLAQLSADELPAAVAENFEVCRIVGPGRQDDILVTGYYQPRFKASRERKPPFVYPLYKLPADLVSARVFAEEVTQVEGRIQGGRLVPYWTRAEIEIGDRLRGNELCYLADPVEVFLLQVQGSGLVEFEDGRQRQILFAGTNGRPYRSIGRLLADEGRIPLAEIDMPRIRRYLHENLDERQRILHYNERYVFFRMLAPAPGDGPVGSMGAVLTPERSVALDQELFPVGGLYFLETKRPSMPIDSPGGWQPMTRFVLHQDTGAAIKGCGRLDFFWGSGDYAEGAAGLMKQPGRLYLLMAKHLREPVYPP